MERDPVCGMLVDPKEAAGSRDHGDKTYFFCGNNCMRRFDKEPARYVDSPGNASATRPADKE